MLSLSNFSANPNCVRANISYTSTSKTHLFYPKNVNFLNSFAVLAKIPSGFCLYASKDKGKGLKNVLEIEEDDEDFDIEEDGVHYDGNDDEVVIPLRSMKKWLENKPRGFGEGKVYDTSIEDKLWEEIEQSKKAQLANVNKLKDNTIKPISKKEQVGKSEVSKDLQEGHRVRVVNLPKKKNVHKDLRLAFKGVSGIINIVPAVHGNKKTRDPVCKGFAFVYFKTEDEAIQFVQSFSGQSIAFGKVQKQIKCEILSPNLPEPAEKPSVDGTNLAPEFQPPFLDGNPVQNSRSIDLFEENSTYNYEDADEHLSAVPEDDRENVQIFDLAETNSDYILEGREEGVTSANEDNLSAEQGNRELKLKTSRLQDSNTDPDQGAGEESDNVLPSSKHRKKTNAKKAAPKRKNEKGPTLNIPGSANRLKIREKAMLTEVFSKYASISASTASKQS